MHDALAYQRDTEVAEVDDDWSPPPARSRVPTGELTVHVMVDGWKHRRHTNTVQSSCKEHQLHAGFAVPMREELVHPLSRHCGCFTKAELDEADDAWREKYGTEPP